jgi:hypothetical protein
MTRVTRATCLSALHALADGMSGVRASFDYNEIPPKLSTSQLPALLLFSDGTDVEDMSAQRGHFKEVHHARIVVLIDPVAQDRMPTRLGTSTTLYDNYVAAIMTNANRDTANWEDCTITKCGPDGTFEWGGVTYQSFDIAVDITVCSQGT